MKRIISALLICGLLLSCAPSVAAAEQTFAINGTTVSASSGTAVYNCAAYASQILGKIFTYPSGTVTTTFTNKYNILKGKSANDRKVTEAHTKEFIQAVPLGARIRICNSSNETTNNYDNCQFGHTQVLVARDDANNAFTVLEGGETGARAKRYTYKSYVDAWTNFRCGYGYFFYVDDFSSLYTVKPSNPKTYCTVTFDPNGGTVSQKSKQVAAGDFIGAVPTPARTGYSFSCWTFEREPSGSAIGIAGDNTAVYIEKDTTLYAQWRKIKCATHTQGEYQDFEANHPHHSIYKCAVCGERYADRDTGRYYDMCAICNPPVEPQDCTTHTRGEYLGYDTFHPHDCYYECAVCGEPFASGTKTIGDCEICSPIKDPVKTDGTYYSIKNKATGKVLNVYYNRSADGTNVDIYDMDYTDSVYWKFAKSGGSYVLSPKNATGSALNVYSETRGYDGCNVCIWKKTGHSTQTWVIEAVSGGYILRSDSNTNLVLTATGSKNNSNVNLKTYSSGDSYQVWTFNEK